MSIRILLADDHGIILDGVRAALERQPDLEVVAEAKDGLDAVKAAQKHKPDVVLMDISMPGMNGIEATRQIKAAAPATKVICLSMHSERRFVVAALEAGASGYLLKERDLEELIQAIHTVVGNQTYVCPVIATALVQACANGGFGAESSRFSLLTSREVEVLQLIAEGHTSRDIAARLHVSVKTVATHRQHVMDKLNIHHIAGLTKYAIERGITPAEIVGTKPIGP